MTVLDPELIQDFNRTYERFTETWDGVYVVPPMPNDEHQEVQLAIAAPLYDLFQVAGLGQVRPGVNVTDRHVGWRQNYRGPDVVVYLNTNPAVNHGTHWVGGPDFLVEIISEGEDPHAKFDFYAAVNTREVLIVERDPWAVESFTLSDGTLVSAGRSVVANEQVLTSGALGLSFRLVAGTPRPKVEVKQPTTGKSGVV